MTALSNFFIAFVLSFAGSIPPGTINLTVIQLGLERKLKIALRFSVAASLIEYPYAWLAVHFEKLITASPVITQNLQLFSGIVLIVLGLLNVWPKAELPGKPPSRFSKSGYRRGLLLGVLNPLAIPYWLGITAYLRGQGWVDFSSTIKLHAYLSGIVVGAFILLALLGYLSKTAMTGLSQYPWVRKIPGFLLLSLGLYSLGGYFIN